MIENLKACPVQSAAIAFDLSLNAAGWIFVAQNLEGRSSAVLLIITGAFSTGSLVEIPPLYSQAKEKIGLKNRVKDVLEKEGFDERLVRTGSVTYCGRQAIKIACEVQGYQDEFHTVVSDPSFEKEFSWLPHI